MLPVDATADRAEVARIEGVLELGKRYEDQELGLEVLYTKPGAGLLTVDGRVLQLKGGKPLP